LQAVLVTTERAGEVLRERLGNGHA
jgi:hypothetical protein